ncbi:MAG: hypothetical protein IJR87_13215 [Bacteroidaceae bacterium]|nr:hypothetical protein [Bacteroidaceae bacterium]
MRIISLLFLLCCLPVLVMAKGKRILSAAEQGIVGDGTMHTRGITFHNVRLSLKDDDFRAAFIFCDAQDAVLEPVCLPILGSCRPFFACESIFTKNCLEAVSQANE